MAVREGWYLPMTPLHSNRPLLDRINSRRPSRAQWEKNPDESSFGELVLGVGVIILWVVILFVILPLMVR